MTARAAGRPTRPGQRAAQPGPVRAGRSRLSPKGRRQSGVASFLHHGRPGDEVHLTVQRGLRHHGRFQSGRLVGRVPTGTGDALAGPAAAARRPIAATAPALTPR